MIIVTGGAGFIGSNLINHLLKYGKSTVVSVDWHNSLNENYFSHKGFERVNPDKIFEFLKKRKKEISVVIHLGAITSTTEQNLDLIIKNNIDLSLMLWDWCQSNNKRLIYASSAATYGDGDQGFSDEQNDRYLSKLIPLNLYGWSKHLIDRFIWNKKIY